MKYQDQELIFGMHVIAWNEEGDEKQKGVFIFDDGEDLPFYVLLEAKEIDCFRYCQPDPDTTEFVKGQWVQDEDGNLYKFGHIDHHGMAALLDTEGDWNSIYKDYIKPLQPKAEKPKPIGRNNDSIRAELDQIKSDYQSATLKLADDFRERFEAVEKDLGRFIKSQNVRLK